MTMESNNDGHHRETMEYEVEEYDDEEEEVEYNDFVEEEYTEVEIVDDEDEGSLMSSSLVVVRNDVDLASRLGTERRKGGSSLSYEKNNPQQESCGGENDFAVATIPDAPSLRLDDDDNFYEHLIEGKPRQDHQQQQQRQQHIDQDRNEMSKKNASASAQSSQNQQRAKQQLRFFHTVPKVHRPNNTRNSDDDGDVDGGFEKKSKEPSSGMIDSKKARTKIPTHIRKIEIELAQRKLPRHPSQTWRDEPAVFYPIPGGGNIVSPEAGTSTKESQIEAFVRARLIARSWFQKHRRHARRHDDDANKRRVHNLRKDRRNRKIKLKPQRKPPSASASASAMSASLSSMSFMSLSAHSSEDDDTAMNNESKDFDSVIDDIEIVFTDDDDDIDEDDFYFLEEVVDEVVETFYGDDHAKLRQVHSINLSHLDEQLQEQQRRQHMMTFSQLQSQQQQQQRVKSNSPDTADVMKDESERVKLAFWLSVKHAQEHNAGKNISADPDSQFFFLRCFSKHRRIQIQQEEEDLKQQKQILEVQASSIAKAEAEGVTTITTTTTTTTSVSQEQKPQSCVLVAVQDQHYGDDLQEDEASEGEDDSYGHEETWGRQQNDFEQQYHEVMQPKKSVKQDDHYEPQVGVVPPTLRALILQAQAELRPPPPPEHRAKYKPLCVEASEIGQFTRLKEEVIEAMGKAVSKNIHVELPSSTWHAGRERIKGVEKARQIQATRSDQHIMLAMAAALGQIRGLKQKVTTNYGKEEDRVTTFEGNQTYRTTLDSDQIDDENEAKKIRLRHLTDYNISEHRKQKSAELWDADILERQAKVHYDRLEDVPLPTEECPSMPLKRLQRPNMSNIEIREAIAHGVAEASWDRRYRLERPRAEQRITRVCNCKYCGTETGPNPYQTLAYRKKWLESVHGVQSDDDDDDEEKEQNLPHATEHSFDDGKSFADDSVFLDSPSMHGEQSIGSADVSNTVQESHMKEKKDDRSATDLLQIESRGGPTGEGKIKFCVEISHECPPTNDDTFGTTESTLPNTAVDLDLDLDLDEENNTDVLAPPERVTATASQQNTKPPTRSSSLKAPVRKKSNGIFNILSRSTHGVRSMLGFSQHSRGSSRLNSKSKRTTMTPTTVTPTSSSKSGSIGTGTSDMNVSRRQRERQRRIRQNHQRLQEQHRRQHRQDQKSGRPSQNNSKGRNRTDDDNAPLTSASLHSFAEG